MFDWNGDMSLRDEDAREFMEEATMAARLTEEELEALFAEWEEKEGA